MPATVLIIDDVATNRILLNVKLSSAGYHVLLAQSGAEGLALAKRRPPDIVLCTERLDDMTAQELFQSIKAGTPDNPLRDVACIAICEHINPASRLALLHAGALDVLTRPPNIKVLLARFRSILRTRESHEDRRMRENANQLLGLAEPAAAFVGHANIALLSTREATAKAWGHSLPKRPGRQLRPLTLDAAMAAFDKGGVPDVIVLDLTGAGAELTLQRLSDLRAVAPTRDAKIIAVLKAGDIESYCETLDRGADDVLTEGFSSEELDLRLSRQIAAKRRDDTRRQFIAEGLHAASTDALTGLYNRRFAMPHLKRVLTQCRAAQAPCAVMVVDIDHFKTINDRFGHAAGDAVLKDVAQMLLQTSRKADVVSRIGGEEFMIVLPDTDVPKAQTAARRLCTAIADHEFALPGQRVPLHVTVSIGVAVTTADAPTCDDTANQILHTADTALYGSKSHGRNCFTLSPLSAA